MSEQASLTQDEYKQLVTEAAAYLRQARSSMYFNNHDDVYDELVYFESSPYEDSPGAILETSDKEPSEWAVDEAGRAPSEKKARQIKARDVFSQDVFEKIRNYER